MGRQTPLGQIQGGGETGRQHHRFGATPPPPLLAAAADQRFEAQARPHQQRSDPPRTLQLVGRTTEQIHRQLIETHRPMAHHLDPIQMKAHPRGAAALADLLDRLERAHLALAPDERHHPGGRGQELLHPLRQHHTEPIHRPGFHRPAAAGQLPGRRHRGGMFHRRNHQAAGFETAALPSRAA